MNIYIHIYTQIYKDTGGHKLETRQWFGQRFYNGEGGAKLSIRNKVFRIIYLKMILYTVFSTVFIYYFIPIR